MRGSLGEACGKDLPAWRSGALGDRRDRLAGDRGARGPLRWQLSDVVEPVKGAIYPLEKPMRIRVIEYRISDHRLGEPDKIYRLATTLLDEKAYPARELIVQYHERWEMEIGVR